MIMTALSESRGTTAIPEKLVTTSKPIKKASQSSNMLSFKMVMFVQTGSFEERIKVVTTSTKSSPGVANEKDKDNKKMYSLIICAHSPDVLSSLIVLSVTSISLWSEPKLTPIQTTASFPSMTVATADEGLSCTSGIEEMKGTIHLDCLVCAHQC